MTYKEEFFRLIKDVDLNKLEVEELELFSDEIVRLKTKSGRDYRKSEPFHQAIRKLKKRGLYPKYQQLLSKHANDSIEDFFRYLDEEL